MLLTRIVQLVMFVGVGSVTVLAVRVLIQDVREHREMKRLGIDPDGFRIPIDYDGEMRRKILVIRDED